MSQAIKIGRFKLFILATLVFINGCEESQDEIGDACVKESLKADAFYSEKTAEICMVSAKRGDPRSQNMIAIMYQFGKGGLYQRDEESVYWYKKAAMQGHREAQSSLAYMYQKDTASFKDQVLAYAWYTLAMVDEPPALASSSAGATQSKIRLINEMTASQIEDGDKLAREINAEILVTQQFK